MSTNSVDMEDLERQARAAKVERLLPIFEAHVANAVGRPIDPLGSVIDARLVRDMAHATISPILRDHPHRTRAEDRSLCPDLWRQIARIASLPPSRYPSVTTIEKIVARLGRRVDEAQRDPFNFTSSKRSAA